MAVIVKGKNPRKPHTVRYWVGGRQRERSFVTAAEARDFRTKVEYESRTQMFVDPKLGAVPFADYALGWVEGLANPELTKRTYASVLRSWLLPWAADRTLRQVANDREGAAEFLNRGMSDLDGELLSYGRRDVARVVLTSMLNEAVRAGRIEAHRLGGIKLARSSEANRAAFVFPSYDQVCALSVRLDRFGPVVWLMRGSGLRIREALAVHHEDFSADGSTLRVDGQSALTGGRAKLPLKQRRAGEYRDVPVPEYLWSRVKEKPRGPVCPDSRGLFHSYNSFLHHFDTAKAEIGIPEGFVSHSLRHAFASALLANGVPISDVAKWLGHRNISTTYEIYAHLVPSASNRARLVLDSEFDHWSQDRQSE